MLLNDSAPAIIKTLAQRSTNGMNFMVHFSTEAWFSYVADDQRIIVCQHGHRPLSSAEALVHRK